VLNSYLDEEAGTGNLIGLAALPLFLSMRAAIRAKVDMLRARMAPRVEMDAARAEVRTYFALAQNFLVPAAPRLIAIGGLSGSGKSAVARAIAPFIGAFPGAVHVRSDVERKRLFGVAPSDRLPTSAYAPEISDRVYAMCRKRALMALEGGQAVIVDAVHAKKEEREAVAALAAMRNIPFTGLWLDAPGRLMRERVAARTGDVSDATAEVVDVQLGYDIGPQSFAVIDASKPLDQVAAACLEWIGARASTR
jgi:predicted kinase